MASCPAQTDANSSVVDADTGEELIGYPSGLLSSTADPQTGIITVRHDYYTAVQDELNQIIEWYYYDSAGYSLDSAHAVASAGGLAGKRKYKNDRISSIKEKPHLK